MIDEGDRRRLGRYAEELDESASRLEKATVTTKTGYLAMLRRPYTSASNGQGSKRLLMSG